MSDVDEGRTAETKAPPPLPPQSEPRRLTRSREQRVIAGVAGGLGEYFGVDPVVFRIGFVAVTLLGGSGILLYLIGWLVIPEQGRGRSIGQAAVHRSASGPAVGVVLLILAGLILLHDSFHWGVGRFTLSVLLIGAGAALLLSRPGGGARTGGEEPAEPAAPPSPAPPAPPQSSALAPPPPPPGTTVEAAVPPPPAPRPPRPRRPRSALGRGTLAAVLVVMGTMGLADGTEAVDIAPEVYLATALLITGLGLVMGAWWGRSRALIVVGALLAVNAGAATAIDVPLRGGFGERVHIPDDLTELDRDLRLFAGEMRVDLSGVDFSGRVTEVEASVGFGELTVKIPRDVRVIVNAEVNAGEVTVLGRTDHGIGSEVRRAVGPRGNGLLRLDLEVGAGEITVR